jgi:hypothetical protein
VAAGPGVLERRFGVRRVEPFLRWVLSCAGEARVVAPPEAVAAWRRLLERARDAQRAAGAEAGA